MKVTCMNTEVLLALNEIFVLFFKSILSSILTLNTALMKKYKINFDTSWKTVFIFIVFFVFFYSIVTVPSICYENFYSDMQRIEDCPLDCNLDSRLTWIVWRVRTTM